MESLVAWIDDLANISPSIRPSIHPIRRQQTPLSLANPTQPFSLARTPPSPPLSRANPSAALLPCRRHLRRQILAAASPSDLAAGAPALSPSLPSPHLIGREEGDRAREQVRRRRRLPDPQGLGPGAPTPWQRRRLRLTGPPWAWTWSSVSSMGSASRSAPPWVGPGAPSPWRRLLPLGRLRPSTARRGKIFSRFALPFSSIPLPDALWLPSLLTQSAMVVVAETSRPRLRCLARFQVVGHPPPTLSFCPPLDPICLGGSSA
mgnify:CR=1 FL=1